MENGTSAVGYNDMRPVLKELETMRGTLSNFVELIKKQDRRIVELESKLSGITLPSKEQILLERFTESSKNNRNLNEAPENIAMAAHLRNVMQVPHMRITECGLMSQSKLHGLGRWDSQHLLDYCEINGVMNIYKEGMSNADLMTLIGTEGYGKLAAYLSAREKQTT